MAMEGTATIMGKETFMETSAESIIMVILSVRKREIRELLAGILNNPVPMQVDVAMQTIIKGDNENLFYLKL
jgi:hypothetical protein